MCGGLDASTLTVYLGIVFKYVLVWAPKWFQRVTRDTMQGFNKSLSIHLSGRLRQSEERQNRGGA